LVLDSFPSFDGSEGSITATYTPNSDVVIGGPYELAYVPLIIVRNVTGLRALVFEMYEDSGALRYNLRSRNIGGSYTDIDTAAPTFVAGTSYRFKMAWKCGTPSGGPPFTSVASDGYVRWYLDDVLIGELTSQPVYVDTTNANAVTTVLLATDQITGGSGLFGALDSYSFFSGAPVVTITGSAVFGVTGTVTATRAVLFSLDGETNVHSDAGVLKICGDLEVTGDVTFTGDVTVSEPSSLMDSIVTTGTEIVYDSSGNVVVVES
jgi:hypothetical protein